MMIRGIYDWTLRLAAHKRAAWALAGVSVVESSVFPIAPALLALLTTVFFTLLVAGFVAIQYVF